MKAVASRASPDARRGASMASARPRGRRPRSRQRRREESRTAASIGDVAQVARKVLLVCAGNRRKEENLVKQTIGFNWGAAGVSTSVRP